MAYPVPDPIVPPDVQPIPPVTEPTPPGGNPAVPPATAGKVPDWVTFGVAFLTVALIAEGLAKVNKTLGYSFVGIVVLGYAMTGGNVGNTRMDKVTEFLDQFGVTSGVTAQGS